MTSRTGAGTKPVIGGLLVLFAAILPSCTAFEDASGGCVPIVVGRGSGTSPETWPGPYPRDLFTLDADGTTTRLTDTGLVTEPSVSSDGRVIAATRSTEMVREDDSGDYDRTSIAIFDPSGEERSSIPTVEGWDDRGPAVSPDGRTVAFLRELQLEADTKLVVSGIDGGERRVLSTRPALERPTWSPDGQLLAVHQFRYSNAARYDGEDRLLILRARDGAVITDKPWGPALERLAWSADGSRILGSGHAGGVRELNIHEGTITEISAPWGWVWSNAAYADEGDQIRLTAFHEDAAAESPTPLPAHLQTIDRAGNVVADVWMDQQLFDVASTRCAFY